VVVHACNPSYLGGRGRKIKFEANPGKVSKNLSQKQKGWEQRLHVMGLSHPSETPLTLAAQTEGSVEVIRTLCLGGAHIDFRARDGMTALHKAACARHCLALTVRSLCSSTPTLDPVSFPFVLSQMSKNSFSLCPWNKIP
jgi:hypothetical protein